MAFYRAKKFFENFFGRPTDRHRPAPPKTFSNPKALNAFSHPDERSEGLDSPLAFVPTSRLSQPSTDRYRN
jgi:hypothetical protein